MGVTAEANHPFQSCVAHRKLPWFWRLGSHRFGISMEDALIITGWIVSMFVVFGVGVLVGRGSRASADKRDIQRLQKKVAELSRDSRVSPRA